MNRHVKIGGSLYLLEDSPTRLTSVHYYTVTPTKHKIEAWYYREVPDVVYGCVFGANKCPFLKVEGHPVQFVGDVPDYIRSTVEIIVNLTKSYGEVKNDA